MEELLETLRLLLDQESKGHVNRRVPISCMIHDVVQAIIKKSIM